MRITGVEVWKEDMQLTRTYRIAGEEITHVENAFILLKHERAIGIGAACPMPEVCGENISDTLATLRHAGDQLLNSDIELPEKSYRAADEAFPLYPSARAAIDMARYDLYCKLQGIPVVQYLGQRHQELETSVTIGITEEAQVQEELSSHLRNGFHVIKVKIGDDVERDIAIVRKLREWGGTGFRLRVDANEGYSLPSFLKFLEKTGDLNIELIEQPLLSPGFTSMRSLPFPQRGRYMADEDLISVKDAHELMEDPPYGVWNIKLMKSGGITPSKQIATLAAQAGIEVMWGCNDESRVSIAAALHAAFSSRATRYLDLDGSFDIARDICEGGFILEDGKLRLTEAPGLGVILL